MLGALASTMIRSAVLPSRTKLLVPEILYSESFSSNTVAKPELFHNPFSSVNARVATVSPDIHKRLMEFENSINYKNKLRKPQKSDVRV